jgi:hypothetical protein
MYLTRQGVPAVAPQARGPGIGPNRSVF